MRLVWFLLIHLVVGLLCRPSVAQEPPGEGALAVSPGALTLAARDADTFAATVELENRGEGPLRVTAITPVDLPAGIGLSPAPPLTIAPGQRVAVEITWIASLTRARDLAGHLVVRSNARSPEGGEVWLGIGAQRGSALDGVLLSLVVWLPLLGLFAVRMGRRAHLGSIGAMAASALVAAYGVARFDPGIAASDGHGGYQLIERLKLFGAIEYHLGVDGLSLPLLVAAVVVFLVAALRADPDLVPEKRLALHLGATGVLGALSAIDAAVFLVFWGLLWFAVALATAERGRGRVAIVGVLSTALVTAALSQMVSHGVPGHLVDGTKVAQSLSFIDLARVPWLERETSVITSSFVLAFLGFALAAPLAGAQGWLRALLADRGEHHALLTKVAIYGVLRIGLQALPEAARWAAPMVAGVAAASLVVAAICAVRAESDAELSSHAAVAHASLALLALMGLTPAGIQACVLLLAGDALARVAVVAFRRRWLALAVSSGAIFAWGPLLAFVGAWARHPAATLVAAIGWVVLLFAHLRAARASREERPAHPVGARLGAAVLGAAAVLLAVYPRPLTWWMDRTVLDLHRRLDPPDGAQIARTNPLDGRLSSEGTSAPSSVASASRARRRPTG
jgi:NADH:ubiquinone oxidoreductase subunit 4 (subunit M)